MTLAGATETTRVVPPPADLVIDIGEEIAAAVGIWLRRDTHRVGHNYLRSFYHSFVVVDRLATEELRIAYIPKPPIRQTAANLSFREVTLRDSDTLQSLAQAHLGDVTRWRELVAINRLDSPFLVSDRNFRAARPATGLLTVTRRAGITGDIRIPKGSVFFAPADAISRIRLNYRTTGTTLLPASQTEVGVLVEFASLSDPSGMTLYLIEAIEAGIAGNIGPHKITQVGLVPGDQGYGLGPYGSGPYGGSASLQRLVTVDHAEALTNGVMLRVLRTGDTIRIPTAPSSTNQVTQQTDYDRLFGRDARLVGGELVTGPTGDIEIVAGAQNLKQALENRLNTFRGELVLHPGYGSEHLRLTGMAATEDTLDLMRFDAARAVASDPRIQRVANVRVEGQDDAYTIDFDATVIGESGPATLNMVVNRG
ncbi:MAG: DUF2634 domain-containing protein [Candidatus Wallbacteria bacterium]|nr:DUF2634 domain-containing protein [Candidatus Wallbacteria bacterium]